MIDIGVASPRAQGQAMIRTATELTVAKAIAGFGPQNAHTTKVIMATPMTAGTNQAATTSASRCIGARLRCASLTIRTICDNIVSAPVRVTCMMKLPVPLTVPPITASPLRFSTGIASPLIIDSSIELWPSTISPSTGSFSPGLTRSRSPGWSASSDTSSSLPSRAIRFAFGGASSSSARIAPEVRLLALSSSTWPSSTSVVMTAAASKYTATSPCMPRNASGKMPGATVARIEYVNATPTPSEISVNMLRLRDRSDRAPRTKNGQPPHSTTGAASANCNHAAHPEGTTPASGCPGIISPIA
jgi:hypothetical protein